MAETNSSNKNLDEFIKEAQLMKMYVELEQLRKGNSWAHAVTRYTPLISVVIAVGGFLFGIYQYQKQEEIGKEKILIEQQKDRETRATDQALRIQSQIRSDLDLLFQFTQDKKQTAAKVRFLLTDLKTYLELENSLKDPNAQTNRTREITSSLIKTISDDCDFSQHREVIFINIVMTDWEDYKQYLTEHPGENEYILDKFITALIPIHDIAPSVVSGIRYEADRGNYDYTKGPGKLSPSQTIYLDDLLAGFEDHIKVHPEGKEKEWYLQQFQAATCNPMLTQQLFGVKFDPKSLKFTDIPSCASSS